ncbi:hypothetical protein [Streptomyces mirabilis]
MRVEIDLNARDRSGRVPAYLSRADGHIAVGDSVTAFEPEDEVSAPAVVEEISHGIVYLAVKWDAMTDDIPAPAARPCSVELSDRRTSTWSWSSWVRTKVLTPVVASAAIAAAGGAVAAQPTTVTTAPTPNTATVREAGDTT